MKPYIVVSTTPSSVSIDPNCQHDPFVRYKMPQLNIQVIGNGKMIRTMFLNIDDVAKSLGVPPNYIPNYIAKSIGAQAKYDASKSVRERASISGKHSMDDMEVILRRFIDTFVLCAECRYPELAFRPTSKKNNCRVKCQSCGWKTDFKKIRIPETFRHWICNHLPPKSKTHNKKPSTPTKFKHSHELKGWSMDTSTEACDARMNEALPDSMKDLHRGAKPLRNLLFIEEEDNDDDNIIDLDAELDAL